MESDSLTQANEKQENQRTIQKHRKTKINKDDKYIFTRSSLFQEKKISRKCKLCERKHIMYGKEEGFPLRNNANKIGPTSNYRVLQ